MKEEWRAVIDFEGVYEVSNLGRVRRIKAASGTQPGRILIPSPDHDGVLCVCLTQPGKRVHAKVHRLVAFAFLGKPPISQPLVNHKDGNRNHVGVKNLEWVSYSENGLHAVRVLGLNRGETHPNARLKPSDVAEIKRLAYLVPRIRLMTKFKVSRATICDIAKGRRWKHLKSEAYENDRIIRQRV